MGFYIYIEFICPPPPNNTIAMFLLNMPINENHPWLTKFGVIAIKVDVPFFIEAPSKELSPFGVNLHIHIPNNHVPIYKTHEYQGNVMFVNWTEVEILRWWSIMHGGHFCIYTYTN